MIPATLAEYASSINAPVFDTDNHVNEVMLVIRLGLSGIHSVEVLADESEAQAKLMHLWASVRPALDIALEHRR